MLEKKARIAFKTEGKHHFFGYYDKCPWSADGRFLLALETDFINRLPTKHDAARIKIFDLESGSSQVVAETRAWNWQQGCMLQWLGPDFKERIIFNDFRGGRFASVIFNVRTNIEEKVISFPIYAVHPSGKSALSLNFSRLDNVREGYGYKGVMDPSAGETVPANDGIFYLNLDTGEQKLALSLSDLSSDRTPWSSGQSWVDHFTFNPSGTRFAFLHRKQLRNGGMYSRLYAADADDSGLFPLLDTGMASHFYWKNDREILVWGRPEGAPASLGRIGFIRKMLVPVYHALFRSAAVRQKISCDAFMLFKSQSKSYEKIGDGILTEDGHCSFSPDRRWLLTDTYAGRNHERKLLLFNLDSQKLIEVGRFRSLPDSKYGVKENWDSSNLRADLHPRWNRDGTQICIDSVHEGSRQMYVIDVRKVVNVAL